MFKYLALGLTLIGIFACTNSINTTPKESGDNMTLPDPYLWLENVEGEKALKWVAEQNGQTLKVLQADSRFAQFEADALEIYEADDKLVYGKIRGDYVYNFWQDENHIRGIWRRTHKQSYLDNQPNWETLLDIDELAEKEGENWVYKGVSALPPNYDRCLIELSRGGKDAVVVREFKVSTKTFIDDGFNLQEAKSTAAWISENKIFVATDFGEGSMTKSGYPGSVRIWNRGESLENSIEIARSDSNDLGVWGSTIFNPEGQYRLISKAIDFWTQELFLQNDESGLHKIHLPSNADFKGIWKGQVLALLRSDWKDLKAGALISLDLNTDELSNIYTPTERISITDVALSQETIILSIQEDVQSKVMRVEREGGDWILEGIDLPAGGVIDIFNTSTSRADFFYSFNNLITPSTLGYFRAANIESVVIQKVKPRFMSENLEVSQKFTMSKDGTSIPYFLVSKIDLRLDGKNPVLLYGYGGFEVSEKPQYRSTTGKLWLEKGGVFALANIRGGGEYGPTWHQAALKLNRHKSFEDFIAIAEDLISNGVTSPEKLGMMGGSNGGLLVGAVFTMRPDLFNAMVCQVPLLDMLRYHKLLAGASWIGEYGDPDSPEMRSYLAGYSPYHNIEKSRAYPKALFITSTKDDRVHPAHARKMVARLIEQEHPVMYYENIEGGHAAGANLKQYATMAAIEYTYLHRMLMGSE